MEEGEWRDHRAILEQVNMASNRLQPPHPRPAQPTQGPSNLNQKSIFRRVYLLLAINTHKTRTNGSKTAHGITLDEEEWL